MPARKGNNYILFPLSDIDRYCANNHYLQELLVLLRMSTSARKLSEAID